MPNKAGSDVDVMLALAVALAGSLALAVAVPEKTLQPADTSSVQEDAAPGQVIVLSRGRGGSTVLAQTIASFAKSDAKNLTHELLGSGAYDMATQINPKRTRRPHARLVGFKLKPYVVFNSSDAYDEAWDWVVSENISVVWMARNLLDVLTSEAKHTIGKLSGHELIAHCHDERCAVEHQQVKVSLDQMLSDASARPAPRKNCTTLVERLQEDESFFETDLEAYLIEKRVRYMQLRFEDLFEIVADKREMKSVITLRLSDGPALRQWNTLFAFLGLDPVRQYKDIRAAANEIQTSSMPASQCDAFEDPVQCRIGAGGVEGLTARGVAQVLGQSCRPIGRPGPRRRAR